MYLRRIIRDDPATGQLVRATVGNAPTLAAQVHPWRVLHVSEVTAPLAALVSGQLEVGMRPEVLTPHGSVRGTELLNALFKRRSWMLSPSLLQLWRQSRAWARLIRNTECVGQFEVVHTHSLSSAFAAARRTRPAVYDIEHFPSSVFAFANDERVHQSWVQSRTLGRIEHFVLNRVTTVCHRNSVRRELLNRGTSAENLFVIPEAFVVPPPPESDYEWLKARQIEPRRNTILYAPAWVLAVNRRGELTASSRTLLEVLAVVSSECEELHCLAEFNSQAAKAVAEWSEALGLKSRLHQVKEDERHVAELAADVIIASDVAFDGPKSALNPYALRALFHQKALLAADVDPNRDLTPEGRGCLWYAHTSPRDLARRAAFLVRNPDFRHTLAASGHNYLRESRDPVKVALSYDAVYKRAHSLRSRGRISPPLSVLAPAQIIA